MPPVSPLPRWRVFPPLALGTLMAVLDISVVGLVLPVLARALGAPLSTLTWVVLAYVLAVTGLLLAFGRLADRVGRRRVYGAGLVTFVIASALCALSPAAGWLIAARALQGVGAAMMSANSAALLVAAFPPEERGRALGAFGAVVGAGLALGPPLGGMLVGALSWHWLFLVNLPLGALAFALLRSRVPEDPPSAGETAPSGAISATAWCAGLVLAMLALSFVTSHGPGAPRTLAAALGAGVAFAVFAWSERGTSSPLLPWDALRGPLGVALALTLLGQVVSMSAGILLPLQLEDVAGFDPARAGRWLALPPLAALFAAPLAGRWADRFGTRPLTVLGLLLAAIGAGLLARLGVENRGLAFGAATFGIGLGLFTAPNASAVMGAVGRDRLSAASGLQATARNLGVSLGAAAASASVTLLVAGLGSPAGHESPSNLAHAGGAGTTATLARAVGLSFTGLAAVSALGALIAGLSPASRDAARTGS